MTSLTSFLSMNSLAKSKVLSNLLQNFFSRRLIFTLVFNYLQIVSSLYYIFIRISFNIFNSWEDWTSFLFLIQPVFCLVSIFVSVQRYIKKVNFLNSSWFSLSLKLFSFKIQNLCAILLAKQKTSDILSGQTMVIISNLKKGLEVLNASKFIPLNFSMLTAVKIAK